MSRKRKGYADIFERETRSRRRPEEFRSLETGSVPSSLPVPNSHRSTSTHPITSNPTIPPVAQPSSSTSQTSNDVRQDYEAAIMASVILDRDIDMDQAATDIDMSDLDTLMTLVEDSQQQTTSSQIQSTHDLETLFEDPRLRNRTVTQASQRMQSLITNARKCLATIQGLSSNTNGADIQETLLITERAIADITLQLSKRHRKELKSEVEEARAIVKDVLELLRLWRISHPDKSPIRIDNNGIASDVTSFHNTSTLVAYALALVGRVMEGIGRRGSSFFLKAIRVFGYSLTAIQPGGPNSQQQTALGAIPEDIRTLEKKFHLDVETTIFASTALANPCGESLLEHNKPIKTFEYYSFMDWFSRFITLPGIAKYSEAFCEKITVDGPPSDKQETADGKFYHEMRGPDGTRFVQDRGTE
ncbi:hypothetical protein F5880DRAFT_1619403, partial [Lentinula raphanica]